MPISSAALLRSIGLDPVAAYEWGSSISEPDPGVYVVSLSPSAESNLGLLDSAPIDESRVEAWLAQIPQLLLDGAANPSALAIAHRLGDFWLPDESIVYIGKATSLKDRLSQYFNHTLGKRSPHKGGHWIKTLNCTDSLLLTVCTVDTPAIAGAMETKAVEAFMAQTSEISRSSLPDPTIPLPFANLTVPRGKRKPHGLRNQSA